MRGWIGLTLGATVLAGGLWYVTRTPKRDVAPFLATHRPEVVDAERVPPQLPSARVPRHARTGDLEPIFVIPETDPPSEPMPPLPTAVVKDDEPDRLVPRPETGRETRPWMRYAEEDAELERLRKEEWDRIIAEQTPEPPLIVEPRDLEETAEPPLGRPPMPWRLRGKVPCSVR